MFLNFERLKSKYCNISKNAKLRVNYFTAGFLLLKHAASKNNGKMLRPLEVNS